MNRAPLHLVYGTEHDPNDVDAWSGLVVFIREALQNAGATVQAVGALEERYVLATKLKKAYYRWMRGETYLRDREPGVQRAYARQLEQSLKDLRADALVIPGSTLPSYVEVGCPLVFWSGSTFAAMLGFYDSFTNLCSESLRHGHMMEQAALDKCSLAIYASDWAAQSAVDDYGADPAKVGVVPYGPNLRHDYTETDMRQVVEARRFETCKLLFVGREWERKGGKDAVAVVRALNGLGVPAELELVGCTPPHEVPSYVKVHGWVSKKTTEGLERLDRLYREAHFFLLPTKAEAFGVVFAEASSYALPSLAPRIGGITTAIREEHNGHLFEVEAGAEAYAERIAELFGAPATYRDLAMRSFAEYQTRLNWTAAGARAKALIAELC